MQTFLHALAYWAFEDQTKAPEVAEGNLDKVGEQHLNPMGI